MCYSIQYVTYTQQSNKQQVVLRKIACVQLKNVIGDGKGEFRWHHMDNKDKAQVRANILEVFMLQTDESMRDLFAECVLGIVRDDFPQQWNCIPEILKNLSCNDLNRVHNALLITRKIVKLYQFARRTDTEERKRLHLLIQHTFPTVKKIFQTLISKNEPAAALMMKLCVKIYWSAMQLALQGPQATVQDVNDWMQLFDAVLKKPLNEKDMPEDHEDRPEWPWWKLKKWVLHLIHRFFSRYGIKGHIDDNNPQGKKLAMWWEKNYAQRFVHHALNVLVSKTKGQYVTGRVLMMSYCVVNDAVELASTYKIMKPHLNFIIFESILPNLAFNAKDRKLWVEDPHEYVRKSVDPIDDYINPKTAAMNLLIDLCRLRKEPLQLLMPRLANMLQQYVAAGNGRTELMTLQKDGALVALGSLSENLMENELYMNALEGLIVQHVLPEFQNPNYPFMRERSCWILMRYCDLDFKSEHHLQCCVQKMLKSLRDPELPVQMMAATSLRFLIDSDTAQKVIEPVLPQVLDEFFRLMNEIGLDDLICSLERIIQRFGDQIVRIAPQLTVKLASLFQQLFKKDDSGEDDEAQMAALTTLECINTILE